MSDNAGAISSAVITDFDGTLAMLGVPWDALREALAVERIADLWRETDRQRWETVTRAEIEAARTALPVARVIRALDSVAAIAILSNNDEDAIRVFLKRFPPLCSRVRHVVGRRALNGPKTDFVVFSEGFDACKRALTVQDVTYIGDMTYELEFARSLGARAIDVKALEDERDRGTR